MTDPLIHQLYCTHCTYGTSALHRHTGSVKDQPFEYSTRAGSIEQSVSHQTFQTFEKLILRGLPLPSDAPADARKRLSGRSSPWRRLIAANTPGMSLLAHVTYRTTDTSKPPRIGSYFAHLLLQKTAVPAERNWSLTDALQMWGSEFWVVEDQDDLPFELKNVSDLRTLTGFGEIINDDTLLSFLTTPPDGEFHDGPVPSVSNELSLTCAIPLRWRQRPAADRLALFTALFQSVLNLNMERRERLVIAIEPSMAALLFYGVIRLLPRTGLVEQLSVSTFEPHNETASFVLSATDFYYPLASELLPSASRNGVAINTYQKKPLPVTPSSYVSQMLGKFLDPDQGPASVDRVRDELSRPDSSGLSTIRDIEQFLNAEVLAERFLQTHPSNPVSDRELSGLTHRAARQKFRELVFTQLRSLSVTDEFWTGLFESPSRAIAIAHLISELPPLEGSGFVLKQLCDCVSERELPRFLDDHLMPAALRLARLRREVEATGQLPAGCDFLWSQKSGDATESPLLERLFNVIDANLLASFCLGIIKSAAAKREVTNARVLTMLSNLAKAARTGEAQKRLILKQLLQDECFQDDDWDFLLRHQELRTLLFELYPNDDQFLQERLLSILDHIPSNGSRFSTRMDILKAAQSRIPFERRNELETWTKVRSHLQALNEIEAIPLGPLEQFWSGPRNRKLEEIGRKLAVDARSLLEEQYGCDTADHKLQALKPFIGAITVSGETPKVVLRALKLGFRDPEKPVIVKKPDAHKLPRASKTSLASAAIAWFPYAAFAIIGVVGVAMAVSHRESWVKIFLPAKDSQTTKNGTIPAKEKKSEVVVATDDKREPKHRENEPLQTDLNKQDASKDNQGTILAGNTPSTNAAKADNTPAPKPEESAKTPSTEMAPPPTTASPSKAPATQKQPTVNTATKEKPGHPTGLDRELDTLYFAIPHDLRLETLQNNPHLTGPATESLTFHSLNPLPNNRPSLIVEGNGTNVVKVSYQPPGAPERIALCVFTATNTGVEITGSQSINTVPPRIFDDIEALWSASVIGLHSSASKPVFHSFREYRHINDGWPAKATKDSIVFPFNDRLPDWFVDNPTNLRFLLFGPGCLVLQSVSFKDGNSPRLEPFASGTPSKVARRWSLRRALVRDEILLKDCFLCTENDGVHIRFELRPRHQQSIFPEKKQKTRDAVIDSPTVVNAALQQHRDDLIKLKSMLSEPNPRKYLELYKDICDIFELEQVSLLKYESKKGETEAELKERQEKEKMAKKDFEAAVKAQLKKECDNLERFINATKLILNGFGEAKLYGSLFYVIDVELDAELVATKGIAVKLAEFGKQGAGVGDCK